MFYRFILHVTTSKTFLQMFHLHVATVLFEARKTLSTAIDKVKR